MHTFLRAVGFSEYTRKKNIEQLLDRAENYPKEVRYVHLPSGETRVQMFTEMSDEFGLSLCGEINDEDEMEREFYFPFLRASEIGTIAPCQIQRLAEKEAYEGMCEEYKVGISLIFYIKNAMEYVSRKLDNSGKEKIRGIMLSGLSVSGKILLPVKKTEKQREKIRVASKNRTDLLEEARKGNPEAMDTLALEDMDLYNSITGRLKHEDIYSIVDSTFMPFGVECDHYTVIGEILECDLVENRWTGEEIYIFTVESSDLRLRIGINRKDLLGEPAVGRRFKGQVWLQGTLVFEEQYN